MIPYLIHHCPLNLLERLHQSPHMVASPPLYLLIEQGLAGGSREQGAGSREQGEGEGAGSREQGEGAGSREREQGAGSREGAGSRGEQGTYLSSSTYPFTWWLLTLCTH